MQRGVAHGIGDGSGGACSSVSTAAAAQTQRSRLGLHDGLSLAFFQEGVTAGQVALLCGAVQRRFARGSQTIGVDAEGQEDAHEGGVTCGGSRRMNP
jgi:hypothetical protein